MISQLSLFEARAERDRRIQYFIDNHGEYLKGIREFAKDFARQHGLVAIDNVREELKRHGYPTPEEMKIDSRIFGAVFKSKDFIPVGNRKTFREERGARSGRLSTFITVYQLSESGTAQVLTRAVS
jgi:hypothetical protein